MVIIRRKGDNGLRHSDNFYSVQARNDSDGGDCDESNKYNK